MHETDSHSYSLEDGANVAVIGGGPAGSFFSIFATKMAKMLGKKLNITIYEPKDFTKDGPAGCNKCGGIISELLVQALAIEGINFPDSVVRKGINSYRLHTNHGSVFIATPASEKTIATVYRGGGPKGMIMGDKESFDKFLLSRAIKDGAVHKSLRIDRIEYRDKRPVLFSDNEKIMGADLVVGAFGINSMTTKIFEDIRFGYKEPPTVTAAITELNMGEDAVSEHFGHSIHLFLVPDKDIKFAAMIPKGPYVTLCILGKDMNAVKIHDFLNKPLVREVLPRTVSYKLDCLCLPKMSMGAPKKPFADRIVVCGDAGSTRLFKDGIGAAYIMGKAAAKTALFQGVSKEHLQKHYYPVYKSIIIDNLFGRYLYAIIDIYRKHGILTRGMLEVVKDEQQDPDKQKKLSSVLWDMFTGNERYKDIFRIAVDLQMHIDLWKKFAAILVRRRP